MRRFDTFQQFYPFYLGEHANRTSRRLHCVGTLLFISLVLYGIATAQWRLLIAGILVGYAFAWAGHFFFEKNRPATFSHPLYSFIGDLAMLRDVLLGRIRW